MGLNAWHTAQMRTSLTTQGRAPTSLVVLPDVFAPFFWRAIYEEDGPEGPQVHTVGLNALGAPHGATTTDSALPPRMGQELARQSTIARAFLQFTLLPVARSLPIQLRPTPLQADQVQTSQPPTQQNIPQQATAKTPSTDKTAPQYIMVYDLRFGSNLPFMRKLMLCQFFSQGQLVGQGRAIIA